MIESSTIMFDMISELPGAAFRQPDDARRMADALNLQVLAGGVGRVVAIRLSDGSTDGNLYDTKADAIRHQLHETLCDYVVIKPTSYTAEDCAARLKMTRAMYDAGWRMDIPEWSPIMPSRIEDFARKGRVISANRKR